MQIHFPRIGPVHALLFTALALVSGPGRAQLAYENIPGALPILLADSNEDEAQRLNPQRLKPYANDWEYQQHRQQQPTPGYDSGAQNPPPVAPGMTAQQRAQSNALEAARRDWQKRPPLPDARNPLLGRWKRPNTNRANSADPFAQLGALMKGGLCELMFGGGEFEFRSHTLVGIEQGTREQELDQVEYRGDARHVAVIPKVTFKLMVFDFDGPDRINWAGQNCALVRVSTAAVAQAKPAEAALPQIPLGITFSLPHGPVANHELFILKDTADRILLSAGVQSSPYGTVLQNFASACQRHQPVCGPGMRAIRAHNVGAFRTDATGAVHTPPLPAGQYYVFTGFTLDNRALIWNVPIVLKDGVATLTLDQGNATGPGY